MKAITALLFVTMGMSVEARTLFMPAGLWESRSYGFVWDVSDERVQAYDVSPAGCVKNMSLSHEDAVATLGQATPSGANEMTLVRPNTRETWTKLAAWPKGCERPLTGNAPRLNLDVFLAAFDVHYPFFSERKVDWPAVKADARARIAKGDDLFDALAAIVEKTGDGHVSISDGTRSVSPDGVVAPGGGPDGKPWTWRTLRSAFRNELQSPNGPLRDPAVLAANNRILYGTTRAGYGYVAILSQGGWAEGQDEDVPARRHADTADVVFAAVMNDLKSAPGLILDIRVNSGGFDAVSMRLARRFANAKRDIYLKSSKGLDGLGKPYAIAIDPGPGAPDQRPVAVLIGPNAVSAAETFALAMKGAPNVALFGRPTRGLFSDAIPKALPNKWTFTLSTEVATDLSGKRIETSGVAPDVPVAYSGPVSSAYWTAEIDAASAWLAGRIAKSK